MMSKMIWLALLFSILLFPRESICLPMFYSLDENSYLLPTDEDWVAKDTTTMVTYKKQGDILMGYAMVHDVYEPGTEERIESLQLLFKCSSREAGDYNRVFIWSETNRTKPNLVRIFCHNEISFQVFKTVGAKFWLKFLSNNMQPVRCLHDALELRMWVSVSNVFMDSGSLFVLNIEPVFYLHWSWILSKDAVSILIGKPTFYYNDLMKFKFLSNKFVQIFSRASLLIKSLFSVSVTLISGSNCSADGIQSNVLAMFYSGDEFTLMQLDNSQPKISGYINPLSGRLVFQNFMKNFLDDVAAPTDILRVCLRLSLNTITWKANSTRKVMEFNHTVIPHPPINASLQTADHGESCLINAEESRLFLFAGFHSVTIANPILCWRESYKLPSYPMMVAMTGRLCKTQWEPHATRKDLRPKCGRMESHPLGKGLVRFPDPLDAKLHSGYLTFGHGMASFQFSLNVVAMPMLNTPTHWSGLTLVSKVTRLQPRSFHCGAISAHLAHPTFDLLYHFRIDKRDGSVVEELPVMFTLKYLDIGPNKITSRITMDDPVRVLEIDFPPIDRWGVESALQVCLICMTRVERKDALMMGLSRFESRSYTKLLFTGFPSMESVRAMRNQNNAGDKYKPSLILLLAVAKPATLFQF